MTGVTAAAREARRALRRAAALVGPQAPTAVGARFRPRPLEGRGILHRAEWHRLFLLLVQGQPGLISMMCFLSRTVHHPLLYYHICRWRWRRSWVVLVLLVAGNRDVSEATTT